MAELTTRQVAAITVAAGALAGALVAGLVAATADSGNGTSSSSGSSSQVATAPVVRTDLSTTVQVGGSIGFSGSYTIAVLGGSTRSATSRCRCCTAPFPPTERSMPACPTVPTWGS
jgi:hypothetical protein